MISQLSGKIISSDDKSLIVDVNGVGYQVFCSLQTLIDLKDSNETITILTEFIVREDSQSLYGFSGQLEKKWFNLLISVQGVGAKAAIAILSSITIDELGYAISNSEKSTVTKAEGVGPKIAGRIINELKDKIPESQIKPLFANYMDQNNKDKELVEDAISALSNLGYNKNNVKNIVIELYEDSKDISLSELISKSLKKLGNKS
jgi:Holliday junction DNA helicase RuvA|tara:strand:+ start:304 stop:915 length:612 start_codon:yes stop_codon:yes gene_type:complete